MIIFSAMSTLKCGGHKRRQTHQFARASVQQLAHLAEEGVGSERNPAAASSLEHVQSWPISNNLNADPVKIVSGTRQLSCRRIIIFFLSTGGCPSVIRCPQMGV